MSNNLYFSLCNLKKLWFLAYIAFFFLFFHSWGNSVVFIVFWGLISCMGIEFGLMIFLHLSVWSYDFSSLECWYGQLHWLIFVFFAFLKCNILITLQFICFLIFPLKEMERTRDTFQRLAVFLNNWLFLPLHSFFLSPHPRYVYWF